MMVNIRRCDHFILIPAIIFFCTWISPAQIAGGLNETTVTRLGGNNYIVGTVFWPSGKPINRRMQVKLITERIGEILTETDDRGQFVFSGIPIGSYTIVIDREDEFEAVYQQVDLAGRSNIPQKYTASIRLISRTKGPGKARVVDAERLKVPQEANEAFEKAAEFSKDGDLKGAIEKLKKAIEIYPAFLDAHNELGVQYMKMGDLAKAEEALKAALAVKGNAFEPLLNLGITYFRQKRFDQAEARIRASIEASPASPIAFMYLGRTLSAVSKFEDSEKAFETALRLSDGKMPEVHRFFAQLYIEKGEYRRAADKLETYLRLVPEPADKAALKKTLAQLRAAPTGVPK